MTSSDLEKAWIDLPNPRAGELSGKRVPGLPLHVPVYVVVDPSRQRQLLVPISEETQALRSSTTRGLAVSTDRIQIADSPVRRYIRLACLDTAHHATFTALCESIVSAILTDPRDSKAAVVRCLERWRSFWAVDQTGLTREAALGLFGELWFIYRWLGPVSVTTLARWMGPLGARHDFQWQLASVEVKTSASNSGSSPVHSVAGLDQLADPEAGQLYLFSLHVTDDSLATNSLPAIVEKLTADLQSHDEARALFSERLAKCGYNPAESERYIRPLRILGEELYRVDTTFPRLTTASFSPELPHGIGDVSYRLSMNACGPWRIASSPSDSKVKFLRE